MRVVHFLTGLILLGVVGCSSETPPPAPAATKAPEAAQPAVQQKADNAAPKALDKKQFGAPITETKSTALADVLKEPAKYDGQTIRTEGVVTAVCKSMGCWMEIGDASGTAHIKMAGHSFFVPKEASGHKAVVQGKMVGAADEAGSCGAKDGCRDEHEKESGRLAKVEFEATGVEFVD
ncbi:DUF4920 domain-containing protein [Chondromyces apiculatus]|uniref:DUF4920 domain-containing protein n=1 Tax=Chondromyces apiculatus TaxID=51 RepID=UPI0018CC39CC|nr:DUF4920 domain-containing protein [Chondromyces apiculatus]